MVATGQLHVRISSEQHERIKLAAAREHRSISSFVLATVLARTEQVLGTDDTAPAVPEVHASQPVQEVEENVRRRPSQARPARVEPQQDEVSQILSQFDTSPAVAGAPWWSSFAGSAEESGPAYDPETQYLDSEGFVRDKGY